MKFVYPVLLLLAAVSYASAEPAAEAEKSISLFGGGFYAKGAESMIDDDATSVEDVGTKDWNGNSLWGLRYEKHYLRQDRLLNGGLGFELLSFTIVNQEVSDSRSFLGIPYTVQLDKIESKTVGLSVDGFLDFNFQKPIRPYLGLGMGLFFANVKDKKASQQGTNPYILEADEAFGWGLGFDFLVGTRWYFNDKFFLMLEIQERQLFLSTLRFFGNDLSISPLYSWRNICIGIGMKF
ncbi:MAG: outer membrane beta-barrel protein [Planctomycetes bacterium]|nr:outer membrane beta-barrel protein [Planctomycetota bacterium]